MVKVTKAVNIKDFLDLIAPWIWIRTGRVNGVGDQLWEATSPSSTDHQHSWVQKQPCLDSSYLNQLMGHGDGNIGEQC